MEVSRENINISMPKEDFKCTKCGKINCNICNFIWQSSTFKSTNTGKMYHIPSRYNCVSSNVIYLVTCGHCNLQYVGHSLQKLCERFREQFIKIRDGNHVVMDGHFNNHDCVKEDIKIQIIDHVLLGNLDQLESKEMFWALELKTFKPNGLNTNLKIPQTFLHSKIEIATVFKCQICSYIAENYQEISKHVFENHDNISNSMSQASAKSREKYNSFREFRRLVSDIGQTSSKDICKSDIVKFFDNQTFHGDFHFWIRHFLPGLIKRNYGFENKDLANIFSLVLHIDESSLLKFDLPSTITQYFKTSQIHPPAEKSTLSIHEVDSFLHEITILTTIEAKVKSFSELVSKCTVNDLKMILRLIIRNFRIQSRIKFILETLNHLESNSIIKSENLDCMICSFHPLYKD